MTPNTNADGLWRCCAASTRRTSRSIGFIGPDHLFRRWLNVGAAQQCGRQPPAVHERDAAARGTHPGINQAGAGPLPPPAGTSVPITTRARDAVTWRGRAVVGGWSSARGGSGRLPHLSWSSPAFVVIADSLCPPPYPQKTHHHTHPPPPPYPH